MNDKLKNILLKINFKRRFDNLFEKHSHRNLFRKVNPLEVKKIVERLGYKCDYYKAGKFFKIDDVHPNVSLNVSIDLGIVEFILDTIIDGEGVGGPFGYMSTLIEPDQRIKKPCFSSYEELEEILIEGFELYESIKDGLIQNQA